MEEVKWFLQRYGSFIVLMAVIVIIGSIALGKRDTEEEFQNQFNIAGLSRDSFIPCSRIKKRMESSQLL